ncbi:MAG: substrate binding domain-containing protein [Bdellovibrionota bacterium]
MIGKDSILSGLIKITAPEDLGASIITPTLAELCKKHSDLKFEVLYSNQVIDLIKDGFDLAVRIGELKDSQLKSQKLGELKLILVASPRYLSKNKIKTPDDLISADCLSISSHYSKTHWKLKSSKNRKTLSFESKVVCNQMTSLMKLAEKGAGIALIPSYLCTSKLKDKTLHHVLSDYHEEGYPVWMLSPHSIHNSAKIKVLTTELKQNMAPVLGK